MKRVEITISFEVPDVYAWPEVSDYATKLYEFAKGMESSVVIHDVDIANIEVVPVGESVGEEE